MVVKIFQFVSAVEEVNHFTVDLLKEKIKTLHIQAEIVKLFIFCILGTMLQAGRSRVRILMR
jgi:hypothetical protein